MGFLLRLLSNMAALAVATWIFSGISLSGSDLKPIFQIVTIPIVLLTLGLFLIVINALMLLLTSWVAGLLDVGWHVDTFWTAVGGAIVVSIVSFIANAILGTNRHESA